MNSELRELIAGWLRHTREQGITNPSDEDLASYLTDKGYDPDVISQTISAIGPSVASPNKKKSTAKKKRNPDAVIKQHQQIKNQTKVEDYDEDQMQSIQAIKKIISRLNREELLLFKRELEDDA